MKKYNFLVLLLMASSLKAQTYTPEQQRQNMEYLTATIPASLACSCSVYVQAQVTNSKSIKGAPEYEEMAGVNKWLMGFCAKSISKQHPGQEATWSSKMLDAYQEAVKLSIKELTRQTSQCSAQMNSYIAKGK